MSTSSPTYDRFAKSVAVALEQFASPYLAGNALAVLLLPPEEPSAGEVLRRVLREAMESLRPARDGAASAVALRRYQHLVLRYLGGATVEEVCANLGVSGRQARRDHHEALEALSRVLWERYRLLHPEPVRPGEDGQAGFPHSRPPSGGEREDPPRAALFPLPRLGEGEGEGSRGREAQDRDKRTRGDGEGTSAGRPVRPPRADAAERLTGAEDSLDEALACGDARESLEAELERLTPALAPAEASLAEIATSALATVRKLADVRAVQCYVTLPAEPLPVVANRSAVRQALVLLLALAVDAENAGVVTLHLTTDTSGAIIAIDAAARQPVDLGETREVPDPRSGRVLGAVPDVANPPPELASDDRLQIARRLVETLVGTLEVQATAPGGFRTTIRLPSESTVAVLAIDDNPDMLRLMQRFLVGTRYRLLQATTAERALFLATTARPDVILLDLMMPTQDGWELLEEIQRRPDVPSIPVVVCSVLRERSLAMSLGAADFLTKPLTQSALLNALARHQPAPAAPPASL